MSDAAILIVEDDRSLRDALAETLRLSGREVRTAGDGQSALKLIESESVAAVVTDYQMQPMDGHSLLRRIRVDHPEMPVVMMTAHGTIERAVNAMRDGANDYLVKPFEVGDLTRMLDRFAEDAPTGIDMVAEDAATREALTIARKVAASDATVLLSGESGTGKEVFACYIHDQSPRSAEPFIAINCAAIPENMLEVMLFGHEKGAYTGAQSARAGKFEQAQAGTLMLDEISEMDLGLQAKLLRVLQEREVERVGGDKAIALDVRVVATTNRDLRQCVADGRFREDLYYRLSVFPLELPPLRKRPLDIIPLARHFLAHASVHSKTMPQISQQACESLQEYDWPGNVRELANLMQRASILCDGGKIRRRHLRFEGAVAQPRTDDARKQLGERLRSSEERLIIEALERNRSRKRAAEELGISPRTLRYKIARLRKEGVEIPGDGEAGNASQGGQQAHE